MALKQQNNLRIMLRAKKKLPRETVTCPTELPPTASGLVPRQILHLLCALFNTNWQLTFPVPAFGFYKQREQQIQTAHRGFICGARCCCCLYPIFSPLAGILFWYFGLLFAARSRLSSLPLNLFYQVFTSLLSFIFKFALAISLLFCQYSTPTATPTYA